MRNPLAALSLALLLGVPSFAQSNTQTPAPPSTVQSAAPLPAAEQALVGVIDQALAGVLYIETYSNQTAATTRQAPFSSPLFNDPNGPDAPQASGSGFFVNAAGYALTNYHVVEGASRLTVRLRDGNQTFDARVVGTAPDYDLALLQVQGVPAAQIRPLTLASGENLRVGQTTIALGAPFGFQFTATSGIVSAVERTIPTGVRSIAQRAIQTDAAINPGNSGGPLVNSAGQVIGINTQIINPNGGPSDIGTNIGLGFAIPIDTAARLLPRLQAGETIVGPIIGVALAPFELGELTQQARTQYNLPSEGALISQVTPNSPASTAGLRGGTQRQSTPYGAVFFGGDVITAVDGRAVRTPDELREYLFGRRAGDIVQLTIRRGSETLTVPVTLAAGTPPATNR
ncbi:S1C family serine protease [Deinococcus yavapaiensis]|uniref:DegP2 peptidase n=1 Tax=Deinococcus yavapaiensis KR-236 TaxID=694435 RepID=A0A318S4D3_9DEIO|nr:trypsin-like peptidase domain-containing protein [Deinococcus yavapaiensis]PYE53395.1 DegP2 peptidase [Deinococcus yavapaiensis KR-236]